VLVVEDDPRIAGFVAKGMRAQQFEVETVTTGREALARLDGDGRIDLMLLDLGLPDMDGLEVLAEMQRSDGAPPVIVITARTDPQVRASAEALGAVGYLTKPFPWATLLSAVRGAVHLPGSG
jgi:two-component system KDP operon response regulator KdpE